MCATWVPQIIGAVPEIQHGESRVTTEGVYSPNVAMSIQWLLFGFEIIQSTRAQNTTLGGLISAWRGELRHKLKFDRRAMSTKLLLNTNFTKRL